MRSLIKVAGSAVKGRSHAENGTPCQDKIFTWRGKDKKSAGIALADGAGSSPHSQIGAEYAANAVVPFVFNHFDSFFEQTEHAGNRIAQSLINGLTETATKNNLKLSEMACTLLFVVIQRRRHTVRYLSGHIGDGIILCGWNGNLKVLSKPERGEYANTTAFLTSRNSDTKLRIYSGTVTRPVGFIIMSDGTADTLYLKRTQSPNQAYCRQIFSWFKTYPQRKIAQALRMNLKHGVFREVSSDDCSLCVLNVS